jgi:hypothetical protein
MRENASRAAQRLQRSAVKWWSNEDGVHGARVSGWVPGRRASDADPMAEATGSSYGRPMLDDIVNAPERSRELAR